MPQFQPNTHTCDDGSDLTVDDKCDGAGACIGINKCLGVTCPVAHPDKCEGEYTCNHANGQCDVVHLSQGTACNDGDDDTQNDICTSADGKFTCKGEDLCLNHQCQPLSVCYDVECDKMTGQCLQTQKDA